MTCRIHGEDSDERRLSSDSEFECICERDGDGDLDEDMNDRDDAEGLLDDAVSCLFSSADVRDGEIALRA